jgi:hypothetical protein
VKVRNNWTCGEVCCVICFVPISLIYVCCHPSTVDRQLA